jgi:hypothetical protein
MNPGNCKYRASCTLVVVPYEKVRIVGLRLFSSNFRPSHDELVERVWIPFLFVPLLFSTPVDPVRCGLSLFTCSVFVALLISFLQFPSLLWCVDQRKGSPVSLLSFALRAQALVCLYIH